MAAPSVVPSVVPEDVYDAMIDSYLNCPKPAKWKWALKTPTGTKLVVRYEKRGNAGIFVSYYNNIKHMIIGDESARKNGMDAQHPGHEEFAEQVAANRTGNHTSKPWKIKVPTAASEPVRG